MQQYHYDGFGGMAAFKLLAHPVVVLFCVIVFPSCSMGNVTVSCFTCYGLGFLLVLSQMSPNVAALLFISASLVLRLAWWFVEENHEPFMQIGHASLCLSISTCVCVCIYINISKSVYISNS